MNAILLTAALLITVGGAPSLKNREPHPLAPSIPLLTDAEYKKIDSIIDRFIEYDIGKLKGAAGKKALDEFNTLGSESLFNLIEGLNRAATMEDSCPAVILAKRISKVVSATEDPFLLSVAKDTIGAGLTAKRHMNVIKNLQFEVLLRKSVLQKRGITTTTPKTPAQMSLAELEKSMNRENGSQLKNLLVEAEKRNGTKAVDLLLKGIVHADADVAKLSQGLLAKNVQHQTGDVLKALLKHDRKEVKIAAAQAIGVKKLRYGAELIAALQDADDDVRQAARRALVQLSGGVDHGPQPDASFGDRENALARWREWWAKQK